MFSFLRSIPQDSWWSQARGRASIAALSMAGFLLAAAARPQAVTPIRIDASLPYRDPGPALYGQSSAASPSGVTLGLNSRYLTLGGKPWLPVMGEFHFSRYPRAEWEDEILKMKAAGVNIVATYVIWIHHEEIEGQFDWSGQRDLREFALLCARHGMFLVARIGPWDHAEVRNGGLPDWVLKEGLTRVNDPAYLASVRAWYGQIAAQLRGLLWKDRGPVIGIQLENEYSLRGPGAGEAHIRELKKIALASGLEVPLYFVTGWDNAAVPRRAVIPVYGGYPAAPWDGSRTKLPPAEVYAFRFQNRVASNVNAEGSRDVAGAQSPSPESVPYLTAEIGAGNQITYHRRPVLHADDIAAMVPVMLGSGVNLYGTYMFHGGENPDGKLSTLQESQATGYPNDLPIKSYDFQAPLGEFGQERASFHKLKVFQYFLSDFGADLAPMTVHAPASTPRDNRDFTVPRASVRSCGDPGFIFFNNYVRGYTMPERRAAQFLIRLPGGSLAVPRHPVDLPSSAYFIWPFNFRAGGLTLRYSTAQLFTRLESASLTTLYFEAIPGVPAEFAIDRLTVRDLHSPGAQNAIARGVIYLTNIQPGLDSPIDLTSTAGKRIRLVVLTAEQAEDAWKVRIGGSEHLLITAQDFFADPAARPERIWLRSRSGPDFAFSITPPLAGPLTSSLPLAQTAAGGEVHYTAHAQPRVVDLDYRQVAPSGVAPPVKIGPAPAWRSQGVAEAPSAAPLPQAARWSIAIPAGAMTGLSNLFLKIEYQADVARFSSAAHLLTDDFYDGRTWSIGLARFLPPSSGASFELSILPRRSDAPVYFELLRPPALGPAGQIGIVDAIRLVPEYQLVLGAAHRIPSTCTHAGQPPPPAPKLPSRGPS